MTRDVATGSLRKDKLEESRLEITIQQPILIEMSAEQRERAVAALAELLLPLLNLYWQA